MRVSWPAALAAVAVLAAGLTPSTTAASGPPVNRAGHCLTPLASDGEEPPCNPFVGSLEWSTNHRNSYASGSSPFPGPRAGDAIAYQDITLGNDSPIIIQVSAPYPDGHPALWFTTVGVPESRTVYKLDYDTGAVLGKASILDEGGRPGAPSTSGVYNLLDRDNHLIAVRDTGLAVYGDKQPGVRTSDIVLLRSYKLPPRALCRPGDRIIGITMTYTGEVAFVTVQGMLGVIPREPDRMRDENLLVASINGARCADASVPAKDLEEVANSISTDEEGGIYPVSTRAQYKFRLRGGRLERVWRAEYQAGGGKSGATLSEGSGSTPDVMGTRPGADKFVVITDGQDLAHLVLFWRDGIPSDWKPIAPGRDRRIACEFPVRFGDPKATRSVSEQSVLTRAYSSVIVNNATPLDRALSLVPAPYNTLSSLGSNLPGNGGRGMERIDWDARTRTCHSVWANPAVSIPNAVPTMSTTSQMIYAIGVRNAVFGLEGVDFRSGEQKLFVPTSASPSDNSFFAATTVGPAGDVWIGGASGLSVFRGPDRPPPRLGCKDLETPRSSISRAAARLSARRLSLRGYARDRACDLPSPASVARVDVSLARRQRGGCRLLSSRGRLGRQVSSCSRPRFALRARLGGRRAGARLWALRRAVRLPAGRYVLVSRARDRAGNVQRYRSRISATMTR
jgi:hypothetical protein